jgi:hypothetical protein
MADINSLTKENIDTLLIREQTILRIIYKLNKFKV